MLRLPNHYTWKILRNTILQAGIIISAFLLAWLFVRHTLATTFEFYDDEGYMLLSFQHYFAGGHLYTEVFSQYGPFNFFAEKVLFQSLHLPVSHDSGREVTLICWLAAAALAGLFTYMLSRSTSLAAAAGLAATVLAGVLAKEPGHPQQLVLPLLFLGCCISISQRIANLLLLGAVGAALFFIKINVGVFYFAAVAITLLCEFPAGLIRKLGAASLVVYVAGSPLMLMRQDLSTSAGGYCLLAILCGATTFTVGLLVSPSSVTPARNVLYAAIGAFSASALILGESIREGMSAGTLMEGILWAPLRHPLILSVPLPVTKMAVLVAIAISTCIIALCWLRERWQAHADWVDVLRFLVGLGVIEQLAIHRSHVWIVATLPFGLIPSGGRVWQLSDWTPRLFVASLAATQFLQAYPVAGSQIDIALAPALLWAFICLHDGAGGLFNLLRRAANWTRDDFRFQESILGGVLVLVLTVVMLQSIDWTLRYPDSASSLPGSQSLHLPSDVEQRYVSLATDIKANCSMLFTFPGMGSFNFWSGVPTPNGMNMTDWPKGLSLEQQQQILEILKMNPRACVLYNQGLTYFWELTSKDINESPLAHYIVADMTTMQQDGGYEIRVNPQRSSP